jgi:hypothetical protein
MGVVHSIKSGHSAAELRCPLYPQKRTLGFSREMSALCQKQRSAASLDHLLSKSLIDQFVSAYLTIDAPL